MGQQSLAVIGQADAARRSMEQAGAEMLLQLGDLAGQRLIG